MNGRNLPPRYRVITRDSDTSTASTERGDRRWDDDAFDREPPAPTLAEDAPSWSLTILFLCATAAGGVAVALLGLIPDVLS
ncbi:hypothetical protein KZ813_01780 [Sphingomonas sp. RHCKR7]|uniref:hypothetical protein n=1 Tax=Sphingomonas folli TaxID=2862497 RepID=UPI001CA573BB|nr:hypothetical protein [Sphingomonas folli]MBW6525563.1 hypothetical protein [Sphingomonas folli]